MPAKGTTITTEGFEIKIPSIAEIWVSAARTPAQASGDVEVQAQVTSSLYPFNISLLLSRSSSLLSGIPSVSWGYDLEVVLVQVRSLGLQVTENPTQIGLSKMQNLLAYVTENSKAGLASGMAKSRC